ncbi:MAG: HlyD family efflux transporter periplasmic adaptor subunit, partial [Planctomycetota bacterium]
RGEAERIAQLVERGSLAPSAGDRAGSQRLAARAAFERTEAELRQAQAALSLGDARLELARAALAEIDVELELSRLVAPFDGRLVGPAPTVGALVGPAVVLGELVGEEVVLRARVGELDLARLAIGQAALVRLPTLPETRPLASRRARVRAVDPLAEPLTRRALVELELDGPPPTAGSFGVATIVTGVLEDAVWVARRHLVWRDGRATAFVLVERAGETFAEQRVLDLSQDHGEGFVVSAGLSVGELLLIEPLDRLTDGIPVATP